MNFHLSDEFLGRKCYHCKLHREGQDRRTCTLGIIHDQSEVTTHIVLQGYVYVCVLMCVILGPDP